MGGLPPVLIGLHLTETLMRLRYFPPLLLTLLTSLLYAAAFAQTGAIRGRVVDRTDTSAVTGAGIKVFAAADAKADSALENRVLYTATADAAGEFVIFDVPAGQYVLRTFCVGYGTRNVPATVRSGQETVVNLSMHRAVVLTEDWEGVIWPQPVAKVRGKSAITGLILDKQDRSRIKNARIILRGTYVDADSTAHDWCCVEVVPDSAGRYTVSNLDPGRYTLTPTAKGFGEQANQMRTTLPDSVYEVDFLLTKNTNAK